MNNSKSRFLRILCLILALVTVLMTFAACANGGDSDDSDTMTVNKEVVDEPVPHYDWGGRIFTVLSVQNAYEPNFEIIGKIGGERIEESVFYRNTWIEEYYNVKIEQVGEANDKPIELLEKTVQAGDHAYDLAFLVRNSMATAIISGYMTDLNGVSYLDFSHDWYNSSTIDSMKISGRLFHMVSDFSLVDKARTNVLFLNRDIAEKNNLPDIIQSVRDGQWTIEQMLTYAKASDSDGDGSMELSDQWGLTCGGREAAAAFWNALGNEVVAIDENENWTVEVANEHSIDSIAELRKLFSDNVSFVGDRFGNYDDPIDTFIDSRALFMSSSLSAIEDIGAKATFSFTALPFPKYDAEQPQYYTTNDNTYCATFGIPTCAADVDFSGFMVEVLSWQSSTTTYPAYYEVVCKVKKSYDMVCAEMLDLVFEGLIFDFGLMYSNYINLKSKILLESIYTTKDITGLYEGVQTATETKISNLFNSVEVLD